MSSAARRARERAEMVDRILDAARNLFVEQGYEAVSMRRIADAIEYTATALYGYFPSKEDILVALCERDFVALAETFAAAMAEPDPIEQLRGIGRIYLQFGLEHPHQYRFMFMTPLPCVHDKAPHKGDPAKDGYMMVRLAAQKAFDEGRFVDDFKDADLAAQTLWAGLHGVIALEITHHNAAWADFHPVEERASAMMSALLRGMIRPAS
jgi:AcrR family transcriptional regulator